MKSKKLRKYGFAGIFGPLRLSGSRPHSQIASFRSHLISGYQAVFAFNFRTDNWDGLLLRYWARNRFAAGAIVGNLTQITDDTGVIANHLHGFRGRVWGAGPTGLYVARLDNPMVIVQFRAVPEFAAINLTQGITLLLGLTFKWN